LFKIVVLYFDHYINRKISVGKREQNEKKNRAYLDSEKLKLSTKDGKFMDGENFLIRY